MSLIELSPAELITWHSPELRLWTATSSHGYLGMVEKDAELYRATDAHGRFLGTFVTLEEAKRSVASPPVSAFAGRSGESVLPRMLPEPQKDQLVARIAIVAAAVSATVAAGFAVFGVAVLSLTW